MVRRQGGTRARFVHERPPRCVLAAIVRLLIGPRRRRLCHPRRRWW
jgi:hypothetical protein